MAAGPYSDFGRWLLETMHARGISQAELARRANCSRGSINAIVMGKRRAGRDLLCSLADALEVPLSDVLRAAGMSNEGLERPIDLAEWVGLFEGADERTREDLLDYARWSIERSRQKSRMADES